MAESLDRNVFESRKDMYIQIQDIFVLPSPNELSKQSCFRV